MVRRFSIFLLFAALLVACGGPATSGSTQSNPTASAPTAETSAPTAAPTADTPAPTSSANKPLREITVAMPYIPNVQFAHYYMADKLGYYAAEGLKIKLDYNFETDIIQRIAQNTVQFGQASGDSVLLARAQGLPITTVATVGQKLAVVFYSKAANNIRTPEDLKGKSVGIPGRFGGSYISLLALLYGSHMQESDLNIQEIGFTQVQALSEDKVQVVSGYGNNEPLQLAQQGIPVNVIQVSDYFPLASDGIVTSEALVKGDADMVHAFVRATLKGMQAVIDNPDAAFSASLDYIPELQKADAATQQMQRKVLDATLPYWQSELTAKQGLGYTDIASWQATHTFLRDSSLLKSDVDIPSSFTNEFIK